MQTRVLATSLVYISIALASFLPGSQVVLHDPSNGPPSGSPAPESTLKQASEIIHAGQSFIQQDEIFCELPSATCQFSLTVSNRRTRSSSALWGSPVTHYGALPLTLSSSNTRDTSTSPMTSTSFSGSSLPLVNFETLTW